jgi:hypothetical protein
MRHNKARIASIFLVALLCGVVLAQDPPPPAKEYNPKAWTEFKSAEGRFSISFPGTPESAVRTADTSIGKLTSHLFFVKIERTIYYVSYLDYPEAPKTPEENKAILDRARDQLLANGERVISEKDMTIAGAAGRELFTENDGTILRVRCFFLKERLYQIILGASPSVVYYNGKPSANGAYTDFFEMISTRFFDSFKLTQ